MSKPQKEIQMKEENLRNLHQLAISARKMAHAPYSQYKVGAALRLSNGKIYSGCNIENVSYGGTVCAERVAIFKALSENPNTKIDEICVATDSNPPWPPCGFCRQVIAEFAQPETKIHIADLRGIQKTFTLAELLPNAFTRLTP